MPELRKDPIVGRWVIIAHERAKRPHDFTVETQLQAEGGFCPFCEGHEDKTPPEIVAYRERGTRPNSPGWRIRVVPNKFPALGIEGTLNRQAEGMFDRMNGIGAHEVIIETPDHSASNWACRAMIVATVRRSGRARSGRPAKAACRSSVRFWSRKKTTLCFSTAAFKASRVSSEIAWSQAFRRM